MASFMSKLLNLPLGISRITSLSGNHRQKDCQRRYLVNEILKDGDDTRSRKCGCQIDMKPWQTSAKREPYRRKCALLRRHSNHHLDIFGNIFLTTDNNSRSDIGYPFLLQAK